MKKKMNYLNFFLLLIKFNFLILKYMDFIIKKLSKFMDDETKERAIFILAQIKKINLNLIILNIIKYLMKL